jgi:glycosyltransferase involved in cell wall biosynthesis
VELSVIICSRNRAASLRRTLNSIARMAALRDSAWEVIVVDNASQDNTREVVEWYARSCPFPIRYVREEKVGLSFARNRGLVEAGGRLLAFTDDDVILDENWIRNIVIAFEKYDAACIGGKILPIWEGPKPKWLSEDLYPILALLDYGDKPYSLQKPKIWGANFAIKASACRYYGPFSTKLGRVPDKLYSGEETELCRRLLCAKEEIMYVPEIVVHHCISKERMKKKYFRKWVYDQGELAAILLGDYSNRNILGIPFYIIRQLITAYVDFSLAIMRTNEMSFSYQLRLIHILGTLVGRLKWKLTKM